MKDKVEEQKKVRAPTFNRGLICPYHKPFCLDIFTSRASISACCSLGY
uniref:Uncharacterized protein n=1 Tax=Rhizophora mucronata TaxID=61149 RepID=A0A2P2NDC1_RHIMU